MKARKPQKDPKARSPDCTAITISLHKKMLDRINAAAEKENRTRSNFIVNALAELLKAQYPNGVTDPDNKQ